MLPATHHATWFSVPATEDLISPKQIRFLQPDPQSCSVKLISPIIGKPRSLSKTKSLKKGTKTVN